MRGLEGGGAEQGPSQDGESHYEGDRCVLWAQGRRQGLPPYRWAEVHYPCPTGRDSALCKGTIATSAPLSGVAPGLSHQWLLFKFFLVLAHHSGLSGSFQVCSLLPSFFPNLWFLCAACTVFFHVIDKNVNQFEDMTIALYLLGEIFWQVENPFWNFRGEVLSSL